MVKRQHFFHFCLEIYYNSWCFSLLNILWQNGICLEFSYKLECFKQVRPSWFVQSPLASHRGLGYNLLAHLLQLAQNLTSKKLNYIGIPKKKKKKEKNQEKNQELLTLEGKLVPKKGTMRFGKRSPEGFSFANTSQISGWYCGRNIVFPRLKSYKFSHTSWRQVCKRLRTFVKQRKITLFPPEFQLKQV